MAKKTKSVAFIPTKDRGSKLLHKPGFTHESQPKGKGIGAGEGTTSKPDCGYVRSAHHADHFKNR